MVLVDRGDLARYAAGVLSGGGGSGQALALRFVNVMIELVFIFSFFLDWFFLFNCLEWRNFIETT